MESMLEWARGPFFRFALVIMLLGLLRHAVLTIVNVQRGLSQAGDKNIKWRNIAKVTASWLFPVGKLGQQPLYSVISMLFHIGLLVVPIFYASHVLLWERGLGLRWWAIPQLLADVLTIATIVAAFWLFFARLLNPMRRALSRFQDYFLLPLLAVPFITGFLASHPAMFPVNYDVTMLIHVLSANVIMIAIPFTKMSHVILLPGTQLISEIGWHFPADMGERVAIALQKENQPI